MGYFRLLRLHQWIKNIFVFFPIFLSGTISTPLHWSGLALCFLSFCFASSAVYVVNDIFDVDRDRQHDVKKDRPIANGVVSENEGWIIAAFLALVSSGFAYIASPSTLSFVIAYIVLNLFYSSWTKHVPLLDCVSIALGFCLRFLSGGVSFSIPVSPHILSSCYFGVLALALIKRRIELSSYSEPVINLVSRPALKGLTLSVLDLLIGIFFSIAIMLYAQWVLTMMRPITIFTLPFISILLSRIICLAYVNKQGEDFSKTLISDNFSIISTALFLASLAFSIYA